MTRDERLAKYRDCASRVLDPSAVDQVLQMVEALEELSDVGELMEILGRPTTGGG
jgi:hypothetical protein